MSIFTKILGDANERYIKSLLPIVQKVNEYEKEYETLSDDGLKNCTVEFKARLEKGDTLDDILPEAFAVVREASKRAIGKRHFDVQLIGGIVLHQGKIAEMKTGEGKTLVATLPLYLHSLAGIGAHLVTPNDYLSRIGAGWMGPVYHALGVSVGVVCHDISGIYDPEYKDSQPHGDERLAHFRPCTRHEAYAADITYGTNNEFGFDYLRDNLEYLPAELRQSRLHRDRGFPDFSSHHVDNEIEDPRQHRDSIPEESGRVHYYALVDEVDSILIDEARTPLIISAPDTESADLYQVFSRITPQLKENEDYNVDEKMRAVAMAEKGIDKVEHILNIGNIYEEKGIRFVHHLEQALRAKALFHKDKDYVVKDGEVIIVDEFTGRLMPGRRWSEGLHQAVEAKEGVKVQQESRTLATITFQNYFRMYKRLAGMTGTAQTSAEEFHKVYAIDVITIPTHRPMIRRDEPDLVFRTENGKFQAVIREVKEKYEKGQPVLIGTVSIEKNERLSKMLQVEGVPHELLNAKNHEREALIIAEAGKKGAVTVATNMAGRGVDIILGGALPSEIKNSEEYKEGEGEYKEVRAAGGLHVIGTERHEARRIDNQLRGRSGRQGDPGSSRFFVSLEDDVMRIFGSERIKNMMESLGIPEDQPIEAKMVSRAIEAAQAKIEGFHFDTRKHVLEYDDVLNKQRDAIYRLRREILFSEAANLVSIEETKFGAEEPENKFSPSEAEKTPLKERIFEMLEEEISRIVEFHTQESSEENWNLEEISEAIKAIAGGLDDLHADLRAIAAEKIDTEEKRSKIIEYIVKALRVKYDTREKEIGEDGMRNIERVVMLRSIDMLWMEHLDQMEHLRDSVRLRAYGQRDPLVEYKNEGSRMFRELQTAIRAQIVNTIFKVGGTPRQEQAVRIEGKRPHILPEQNQGLTLHVQPEADSGKPVTMKSEPNRNDPCFCGSGKKYKKCHGK
ncbi:MAG: preprotein translocase subunit SecA [Parcubacteria group bacterium Gr01-1014_33]|nr:MAG: preprotein translocase subunit SecA [Parcubacteria group bacterium Gr01-1014_33]